MSAVAHGVVSIEVSSLLAVIVARRAWSAPSTARTPMSGASSRSSVCWSISTWSAPSVRGVVPCRATRCAAVPAAWPWVAHVAITRVEPNATCDAEMFRPAKSRFATSAE